MLVSTNEPALVASGAMEEGMLMLRMLLEGEGQM